MFHVRTMASSPSWPLELFGRILRADGDRDAHKRDAHETDASRPRLSFGDAASSDAARTSGSPATADAVADSVRDAAFVDRMARGDESALEALVVAYAGWLVNVATPIVASSDLAQDVVQDVFIRLWDLRAGLAIRGSVAGYLYRAVCNRARNLRAHEGAQHTVAVRARDMSPDTPPDRAPQVMNAGDADIDSAEFQGALREALATLQPRMRDIFLMRAQAEMSYAQIAETFGIGIPTVRVQMSRAMKALARQMARWIDPDAEFAAGFSEELGDG